MNKLTAIIGPTEFFVDAICSNLQHNAHCGAWRWHFYLQDAKQRAANVREGALRMIAERRAEREQIFQQAAE